MSAPRDPLDQLARRDSLILCQLSLQGGKQADCGMSGEHDGDFCASASNCEFEPVAAPSGRGRVLDENLCESLHSSPSCACDFSQPYRTVATKSVANGAASQDSRNICIRQRPPLRTAKRARPAIPLAGRALAISAHTAPRHVGRARLVQIRRDLTGFAPRRVEERVLGQKPERLSVSFRPLDQIAPASIAQFHLHFTSPHFARREHGRAVSASQL